MRLEEAFSLLKKRLLQQVKEHYGDNLVSLVIFGSAARGTQSPESDLDFLLVVKGLSRGRGSRTRDFIEGVEEKMEDLLNALRRQGYPIELSPIIKTPEEVLQGGFIYLDMMESAEVLYDRDGFFKGFMENFRQKYPESKKVFFKGGYYWEVGDANE